MPYPKGIIESGLLDHVAGNLESIKSGASMYVVGKFCLKQEAVLEG